MPLPVRGLCPWLARRTPLPQELLDHIIGYHHDDLSILQEIALVSRPFLCSARRHIFHTVTISLKGTNPRNLSSFTQLLQVGGPSICMSIHTLALGNASVLRSLKLSMLTELIQQLPLLRQLTMSEIPISEDTTTPTLRLHWPTMRTLDRLIILSCSFLGEAWRPLFDLIGLFDSISHLSLNGLVRHNNNEPDWSQPVLAPGLALEPQPQVHPTTRTRTIIGKILTFIDNTDDNDALVRDILTFVDLGQLESLAVGRAARSQEWYNRLLSYGSASSNLNSLIIRVNDDRRWAMGGGDFEKPILDLSPCTALESIWFIYRIFDSIVDFKTCAFNDLTTLPPSSSVSTVTVQIAYMYFKHDLVQHDANLAQIAKHVGWCRLGKVLRGLPALKSVRILFVQRQEKFHWAVPTSVQEPILGALSGLGSQCKVHFEGVYDRSMLDDVLLTTSN